MNIETSSQHLLAIIQALLFHPHILGRFNSAPGFILLRVLSNIYKSSADVNNFEKSQISKLVPGIQNGLRHHKTAQHMQLDVFYVLHIVLFMILPRNKKAKKHKKENAWSGEKRKENIRQKVFEWLNLFHYVSSSSPSFAIRKHFERKRKCNFG